MKFVRDDFVTRAPVAIHPRPLPTVRRFAAAVSVLGSVVVIAVGCSTQQQPAGPPIQAPSSDAHSPAAAPPSPPAVASAIDPRWMGLHTSQPWNWEQLNRRVTSEFQQFGFRPADETEFPRRCNGCGQRPPTAYLTVYAAGAFDPTDVRTGQPVSVVGDDGFFRASQGLEDAVLAWPYAENAWATVRGTTTATSDLDRMLELARAVRPTEHTPIRTPLRLANVPAHMPLAQISRTDYGPTSSYSGTSLSFGACGHTDTGAVRGCFVDSDHLDVKFGPGGGRYEDTYFHPGTVAWTIGGKDGRYDKDWNRAAVQIQDGMLVEFELDGPPSDARPTPQQENILTDILANVTWASDLRNDATWQAVTDWAK